MNEWMNRLRCSRINIGKELFEHFAPTSISSIYEFNWAMQKVISSTIAIWCSIQSHRKSFNCISNNRNHVLISKRKHHIDVKYMYVRKWNKMRPQIYISMEYFQCVCEKSSAPVLWCTSLEAGECVNCFVVPAFNFISIPFTSLHANGMYAIIAAPYKTMAWQIIRSASHWHTIFRCVERGTTTIRTFAHIVSDDSLKSVWHMKNSKCNYCHWIYDTLKLASMVLLLDFVPSEVFAFVFGSSLFVINFVCIVCDSSLKWYLLRAVHSVDRWICCVMNRTLQLTSTKAFVILYAVKTNILWTIFMKRLCLSPIA